MTMKQIENRVKKLKALEGQQKELEKQIEEIKTEIKADMERKGLDEQQAGDYTVRFTTVTSNKFDSKSFKAVHSGLYNQFLKTAVSKRFSIVA